VVYLDPVVSLRTFAAWLEATVDDYHSSVGVGTALFITSIWANVAQKRVDWANKANAARSN
jgi:hypothetical protein